MPRKRSDAVDVDSLRVDDSLIGDEVDEDGNVLPPGDSILEPATPEEQPDGES